MESAVSIVFWISAIKQHFTTHRFRTCVYGCWEDFLDVWYCSLILLFHHTCPVVSLSTKMSGWELSVCKKPKDVIRNNLSAHTGHTLTESQKSFFNGSVAWLDILYPDNELLIISCISCFIYHDGEEQAVYMQTLTRMVPCSMLPHMSMTSFCAVLLV